MKIQLERTLSSCSPKLGCVVCRQPFEVSRIRTLLCNDGGLIYGDVCSHCLSLKADGIKQKLRQQANHLLEQQKNRRTQTTTEYKTALELLEAAEEDLRLPTFYHWWMKKLEILSQETQELEKSRLGLTGCQCEKGRSRLRITFLQEDP